jgi:hypothetical protein
VMVLDIDNRPEKQGLISLEMMKMERGLPATLTVRTPTGGLHIYLRTPPGVEIANAVEAFPDYPGIDVRGDGGYVVAPGAVLPKGAYTLLPPQ